MTAMDVERVMLDTNILLSATDEYRREHQAAREIIETSGDKGCGLCVSGQILREYLAVATRPMKSNGLGLTTADAIANARAFLRYSHLHEESDAATGKLIEMCKVHDLRGKRIHDANIVATMLAHGIGTLLTQNTRDFACFTDIRALTLEEMGLLDNSH